MVKILGLSGSLRKGSYNTALLRTSQAMMPDGAELIEGSIADIPLYNGDLEDEAGPPDAVVTLKDQIKKADGLLLFTPEYNNSIPGVFKNAIDWASRPASEIPEHFGGKPVAVLGASLGRFGTLLSQDAWLSILRTLGTRPWFEGRMLVSGASKVFDHDGRLVDEGTRERLQTFLDGFANFVKSQAK